MAVTNFNSKNFINDNSGEFGAEFQRRTVVNFAIAFVRSLSDYLLDYIIAANRSQQHLPTEAIQ